MQVFFFLSGIMLLILTSATSSKGQNMKVRISAIGDTIIFKFIRPHDNSRLDGYILGYGSSTFSKQLIHLPEDGELYETEIDAEPKYLIAVQSLNPDKPKKKCAGKVDLQKPLNIVIGSVTESSVLLSWGTLLTSPFMDSNVDDCFDDGQFTVRYREKEPSNTWNYQTCPTTSTVIDNLKPGAQYEFEVRADSKKTTSGVWTQPVIHNTVDNNEPFKELNQAKPKKPVLAVLKNITQAKPAPFLAHTVLPELQATTEAEEITTAPIFLDDLPPSTQTPEFPHTSINPSTPKITSTVEHTELTSQPSTTSDQPITITPQALTTEHQPTTTHQPSTTQEQTISITPEQTISKTPEQTISTTPEQTISTTPEQTISTTQELTTSTTQEQTTSTTQELTTSTTQEQTTSTTQEQTTTTQVLTKEQQYTTRQQMIIAQQQFIVTTYHPIPTQTNPPPTKPPHTQQHTTSKVPLQTVRPSSPKEPDTITQDKRNTGEIPPKLHRLRPILHPRGMSKHQTTDSYHFHQTTSLYQSSSTLLSQQQLDTTVGHSPQNTFSTPSTTVANRQDGFVSRQATETNKESIYSTKPPISKYSTRPHHTTDKPPLTELKPTSYPIQPLPTLWYQPQPSTTTQHSSTAKQQLSIVKYHPDIIEMAKHNLDITERAKHYPDITEGAKHNPDVSETAKHYIDVTRSPKYNPDVTENAKQYPDITEGVKHYPDITEGAKYYPDIIESAKHYTDITEGVKHYPDITEGAKHYPDITEGAKHYPDITEGAKHYPDITEGAKHYPDITEGAKHYPDITEVAKHYPDITEGAKHYPDITEGAKHYPDITEGAKHYPDITEGAKHYPDITEGAKHYPDITEGAKHYPDITEGAKHYPDITEGAKHYPDITEGAKHYPDITEGAKHYPDVTEGAKHYPDVTESAKDYPDISEGAKPYPDITKATKHYPNFTESPKYHPDVTKTVTETVKHYLNITEPVKHYPHITQTPKHYPNMTKTAKYMPKTESQIEILPPNPKEQLPGTSKNLELKPTKYSKTYTKSDAVQDSSVAEKVTVRMDQPNRQLVPSKSKDKPLTNEMANRSQGRGIFRNSSSVPRPLARNMTHKLRPNGRVSPNLPINVQRNSTNNRKRVPSGEHHIGLWGPKPDKVPRKNNVKMNTNQVPESTIKDVIDLKQIDPLPLKPLAPPTTEKPTYQETAQPPHYLNGSSLNNPSVFSPLPVSEIDPMGETRFIAPHVIYKTDKRPEEPCSVTHSLKYFPEEEVGYINVTGPPKIPISNLTVVTVEGCPSFVIIDWEKTDNETTEYEVESTTKGPRGKEVSIVTTNQTHAAVENLTPKTSYEFKVTPKNELGTGPTSDPVSFSTESADPRVSEIPTGKTAIWSSYPFKADSYTECNGKQYIKRTWYRKFVGIQLCNSLKYKIYLSDSLKGKFYSIGDEAGLGEDHCQFVDSYLDGRTGGPLPPNQLPPRQGYFRAVRQEPVRFGEIGGNSLINYVAWYECGIPIPGKW